MDRKFRTSLGGILLLISAWTSPMHATPYLEPRVFSETVSALSIETVIDYAYSASGLKGDEKNAYTQRFMRFLEALPADDIVNNPRPGEALLLTLHDRLFTRYSEPQTFIHNVFDSGVYNCVSSAVIYTVSGLYLGLDIEGVLTPDHAFCSIGVDGGRVDVETTTPYGYNPGEKREFVNSFGQTGFTYVPPGAYHLRESIGIKRLISIILQNRISLLERKKNYKEAVELSVERYALSPDEKAYSDLFTEFRNYASTLNRKGLYEEALSFIDDARALYGNHETLGGIIPTIVYNTAVAFSATEESGRAVRIIEERYDMGDISTAQRLESMHIIGDAVGHGIVTSAEDFAAASLEIDELYQNNLLPHERYVEFKVVLVTKEAELLYKDHQTIKALHLIREAISVFGDHSYLTRAEYVFEHNAAVEFYNQAVSYMEAGNSPAALEIIEDGLTVLPGNSILTKARRTILSSQQ